MPGCTPCSGSVPEGRRDRSPSRGKRLDPRRGCGMVEREVARSGPPVVLRPAAGDPLEGQIIGLWRVLGWEVPVKAIVAAVEG